MRARSLVIDLVRSPFGSVQIMIVLGVLLRETAFSYQRLTDSGVLLVLTSTSRLD